jgi:hypothetical protein
MQAHEQDSNTLRRAIRNWFDKITRRRDPEAQSSASETLAYEFGLPADVASQILDRTAADLRSLAESSGTNVDIHAIIDRAVGELSRLGFHSRPFDPALLEQCLKELPRYDYQILRYFKQGKKHSEIAALMKTDVVSVRRSLVQTYADLRMKMTRPPGGGDGGMPCDPPRAQSMGKH